MTTYERTETIEAMQWWVPTERGRLTMGQCADLIVEWVNTNGGQAWYKPDPTTCYGENCPIDHGGDTIVVRSRGGAFNLEPGDYVVMTNDWYEHRVGFQLKTIKMVRHFTRIRRNEFEAAGWRLA